MMRVMESAQTTLRSMALAGGEEERRRGAAFPGSRGFYALPVFAQRALITLFPLKLQPRRLGFLLFA